MLSHVLLAYVACMQLATTHANTLRLIHLGCRVVESRFYRPCPKLPEPYGDQLPCHTGARG